MVVLTGMCMGAAHILAQGKKKKKGGGENQTYITRDSVPSVTAPQKEELLPNRYFLFPQFYSYWPANVNDTILKYECFDANQNPINVDTLQNVLDVKFISLVRSYTDYVNTYIDSQGKASPVPISKMLYKYDRTGADSWRSFDYSSNYVAELREYKDDVMKADTTVLIDPITGTKQLTVRRFYRVLEIEKHDSTKTDTGSVYLLDTTNKKIAATYFYYYPEFYFRQPKKVNDTTFEFLCYDFRDSLVPKVENYDSIRYYSLFKTYTDSAHTYTDSNGLKQFLPVSSIVQRYDRIGRSKWMCIEYPGNKYTELTEYKSAIIKSDTVSIPDPVSNDFILKIYNQYKVLK